MPRSLAALAPDGLLRAVDRVRARRFLARVTPLNDRFAAEHGRTVLHGPFAGLEYGEDVTQAAKLAGVYERELHGAVEELVAAAPGVVVNVGCGEGYYAVGLARRLPQSAVLAHDLNPDERSRCADLARRNGVADRVDVRGLCDVDALNALPADGVALVLDCEGAELDLLRPDLVPAMASWPVLVELHDFDGLEASTTIPARFARTHEVVRLEPEPRRGDEAPEFARWDRDDAVAVLDEHRPHGLTSWAWMRPRSARRSA